MSQPWEAVQAITSALAFVDSTIYVVYTIKTFRQIKRQTDLQTQALLSIAARVVPLSTPQTASTASETGSGGIFIRRRRPAERTFEPGIVALHEKWKNILAQQTNPAITRTEKIVILKIRNHGQSDVVSWTCYVLLVRLQDDPTDEQLRALDATDERVPVIIASGRAWLASDWSVVLMLSVPTRSSRAVAATLLDNVIMSVTSVPTSMYVSI